MRPPLERPPDRAGRGRPRSATDGVCLADRVAHVRDVASECRCGLGDADSERALHVAAFDSDLALMADGLETRIGPGGMRVSGGQVHRVVAARAVARVPALLVLDDPTSALDLDTENQFWAGIRQSMDAPDGPDAVRAASHRRAALEHADQIIVLDRGQVVRAGQLHQLVESCPQMRRLWNDGVDVEAAMD